MQIVTFASMVVLTTIAARTAGAQQSATPAIEKEIITVQLSNFAYTPEHLRLRVGSTVRLRLINESNGGHDFNSPAFFASSGFPAGSTAPQDGSLAVGLHQTVEITVVPRMAGIYRLECTHFLHSIFGMHGTIEVMP